MIPLFNPSLNLPYTVLLDRDGTIRYVHQGYSPGDERVLEERIKLLLEGPAPAPGRKTSVGVNESFLLRLPQEGSAGTDPDVPYTEILDQIDVTVSNGGLLAGVRLDANLDLSPVEPEFRLAKRFAQYSAKGFRGRAGDFYTSLGRGLVFSLVKVFEEEGLDYVVDTTVDGGQVSIASGPIEAQLFGGWIDRPEDRSIHDKAVGGSLGWKRAGLGTVRVQGASADLEPGSEFGNHRVDTGSVSLELPELWRLAAIYGEFSLMRRQAYDAEGPVDGHGLYLASRLRAGRFSLLLEMKDYEELNFEYGRPPLLESEELDILADQFDLDRTDITGYAARLDYYAPASETLLYAKFLGVDDSPENHRMYGAYDREIGHVYAGIEKKFAGGGYLNGLAGWRWETATSVAFLSTAGETFHDQINANWPLGSRLEPRSGLEAQGLRRRRLRLLRDPVRPVSSSVAALGRLGPLRADDRPGRRLHVGTGELVGRPARGPVRRRTFAAPVRRLDQGLDEVRRRRLPPVPAVRGRPAGGLPEVLEILLDRRDDRGFGVARRLVPDGHVPVEDDVQGDVALPVDRPQGLGIVVEHGEGQSVLRRPGRVEPSIRMVSISKPLLL